MKNKLWQNFTYNILLILLTNSLFICFVFFFFSPFSAYLGNSIINNDRSKITCYFLPSKKRKRKGLCDDVYYLRRGSYWDKYSLIRFHKVKIYILDLRFTVVYLSIGLENTV